MRSNFAAGAVLSLSLLACGGNNNSDDGDGGGDGGPPADACIGLECQVVNCAAESKPSTTITGTVYAPNGSLPLYGVNVYIPRETPGPFTEGAQCSRCSDELSGYPIARVQTDDQGRFVLENVPAGDNIPLVITTGKWRRQITIPRVEACGETALVADQTRLPQNKAEGDIPKIAITTGSADALECLIRKIGISDSEITTDAGSGRIHLYSGNGAARIGSTNMANATTLWNSESKLKQYDITLLSCEGGQRQNTKSQVAMDAMKAYADFGGRVFMSHWHNIWIEGATTPAAPQRPAVWPSIATFNNSQTTFGNEFDVIDEVANPKGPSFANWMLNVGGGKVNGVVASRGEIEIAAGTGKNTVETIDPAKAERWVYWRRNGVEYPQNFQFTTPNEAPAADRCGKVVFSDMHVSGDSASNANTPFPGSCADTPLTPQEKALAFMFFDIASCVGPIF